MGPADGGVTRGVAAGGTGLGGRSRATVSGPQVPGVGLVAGVIWPTAAVMLAAAILIHTRVPRTVGRLAAPAANMEALS